MLTYYKSDLQRETIATVNCKLCKQQWESDSGCPAREKSRGLNFNLTSNWWKKRRCTWFWTICRIRTRLSVYVTYKDHVYTKRNFFRIRKSERFWHRTRFVPVWSCLRSTFKSGKFCTVKYFLTNGDIFPAYVFFVLLPKAFIVLAVLPQVKRLTSCGDLHLVVETSLQKRSWFSRLLITLRENFRCLLRSIQTDHS